MALYQDIMKIPGLSGNAYQRQKQYWDKLGYGGGYTGSYGQNIKLMGQLGKANYGIPQSSRTPAGWNAQQYLKNNPDVASAIRGGAWGGDPLGHYLEYGKGENRSFASAPSPAPRPQIPIAQQIDESLPKPRGGPGFKEVMPFYKAWGTLEPMARQAAGAVVNPEASRVRSQAENQYMMGMAGSGSGRFGRAWGGLGSLQAESERQRKAQVEDMLGLYKGGFQDLFYNPSEEAWTIAMTQAGPAQVAPDIPTWGDFAEQYTGEYGGTIPTIPEAGGYTDYGTPEGKGRFGGPAPGGGMRPLPMSIPQLNKGGTSYGTGAFRSAPQPITDGRWRGPKPPVTPGVPRTGRFGPQPITDTRWRGPKPVQPITGVPRTGRFGLQPITRQPWELPKPITPGTPRTGGYRYFT